MAINNEFLKKVIKQGSIDTKKYRYRVGCVNTPKYQYATIMRIPLNRLSWTDENWELIATTRDGKRFMRPTK